MLKYIILFIIIYTLAEKLEIIRQRRKRKKVLLAKAAAKAAEKEKKEQKRNRLVMAREKAAAEKAAAKAAKEAAAAAKAENRKRTEILAAGSNMQYNERRTKQIESLIELSEDKQSGTTYGSKEWVKYQKQIMNYEKQLQTIQSKNIKYRNTLEIRNKYI